QPGARHGTPSPRCPQNGPPPSGRPNNVPSPPAARRRRQAVCCHRLQMDDLTLPSRRTHPHACADPASTVTYTDCLITLREQVNLLLTHQEGTIDAATGADDPAQRA